MNRSYIGRGGLGIAVSLFLIAAIAAYSDYIPPANLPNKGICFPSPNQWIHSPILSFWADLLGIGACAVMCSALNKRFNIIRNTDTMLPAVFLIMTAGVPILLTGLGVPVLLCMVNIACMGILFEDYKSRNATQHIFVVATLLSLGTMVQYSFALFIPAWVVGMGLLNILRLKETVAFLLGIIAPYWVVIGLGIVPISEFRFPEFSTIFTANLSQSDLLWMYINLGVTAIMALVMGLDNSMKLFAGNQRTQTFNSVINTIGIISVVGMIGDYTNFAAYVTTFFFTAAMQCANSCALGTIKLTRLFFGLLILFYSTMFVLQIL